MALSVLVVDDDKGVRDFLSRYLNILGMKVTLVEDGYKAVEAVQQSRFDLALIDVRMPGMNGTEAAARIREADPDAQLVMMTGYEFDQALLNAKNKDLKLLRKPFDLSVIKAIIDQNSARERAETGGPLKVLVVDDSEMIRTFFAEAIEHKGAVCFPVPDKAAALAVLDREKIDLVFIDLVLDRENGVDVFKAVKDRQPQAEIFLMTAYPGLTEELEAVPAQGLLFKPLDIANIIKHIDRKAKRT